MPDHSAEIARLQALLDAGVTASSVDGRSASFNPQRIRQRLAELLEEHDGSEYSRPKHATITLRRAT